MVEKKILAESLEMTDALKEILSWETTPKIIESKIVIIPLFAYVIEREIIHALAYLGYNQQKVRSNFW